MTNRILAENFKKYRAARGMTQEEVARALHVNAQTVSRWECASTLPDVLTLPELARLYGVTVDDFYKKRSVAYDNYAQRLAAVYEKTMEPEDFLRCVLEYQRLMQEGELSAADKWNYAAVHHFMLCDCKDKALQWYDKAIAEGPGADPHVYSRARSLRNKLRFTLGQGAEVLEEQRAACDRSPGNAMEWMLLIEACMLAGRYEQAYSVFREAVEKFPDHYPLYIHGGDICKCLKRYDEAFGYWDRAGELGTAFYDEYYCRAYCYEAMGEYEKSCQTFRELAGLLRRAGYDVEAEMAEADGQQVRLKIKAE